jgi:hypothetical protein
MRPCPITNAKATVLSTENKTDSLYIVEVQGGITRAWKPN